MSDDAESKKPPKQTEYLGQRQSQPMTDRPARPQTNILGPSWRLQFKFSENNVITLDMRDVMVVGRSTDDNESQRPALDLAPFGAYQNGVSRQHAAITRHQGGLYIEDLGSTNGTRINGFQLTARRKYRLRDGDEVEFSRIRALVRFVRPDSVPEGQTPEWVERPSSGGQAGQDGSTTDFSPGHADNDE